MNSRKLILIFLCIGALEAYSDEKAFVCRFSDSPEREDSYWLTLIINTKQKYLRFGDIIYNESFINSDLYVEAIVADNEEWVNSNIQFNKITGETIRRQIGNASFAVFYDCKATSKLLD